MRIITGGRKNPAITAMEEFTGLVPLDLRREEKVLTHSEKLKRLPSHPAHQHLQAQTKNRLKRSSFNHLAKELKHTHRDTLPSAQEEQEPFQHAEAWNPGSHNLTCISEVPGVTKKGDQLDSALNALTQEMLQHQYNTTHWTHVYTDGSSDAEVRNGGSGIYIKFAGGRTQSAALPSGKLPTNYRAETIALLEAARRISEEDPPILSCCLSDRLQVLQSPKELSEREVHHPLI